MTKGSDTAPDCKVYLVDCGYPDEIIERIQALTGKPPQVEAFAASVVQARCAEGRPSLIVYGSFDDAICRAMLDGRKVSDIPSEWSKKAVELVNLATKSNKQLGLVQDRALFLDDKRVHAVIGPLFCTGQLEKSPTTAGLPQSDISQLAFARLIAAAIPELRQVQDALCQNGLCLPVTGRLAEPIDTVAAMMKHIDDQANMDATALEEEVARLTVLRKAEREADVTSRELRLNLYLADLREKQAYVDDMKNERWRVDAALRQLEDTRNELVAQRKTSAVLRARLLEFEGVPTILQPEVARDA